MKYAVLLFLAACTDPVVDMQLVAPTNAAQLDTSCVVSVEVHVDGPSFPADKSDQRTSCIPLDAASPTYDKLLASIRGKFAVTIPEGGLSNVEVYGWAGSCDRQQGDTTTPDLIFFASQQYAGDDLLEMRLVPNLDCRQSQVNVHLIDLVKLVSDPNPTEASCANAQIPADPNAGANTVTLMPTLVGKGIDEYGGRNGAAAQNSVASFSGLSTIGPKSCLAWDAGSSTTGGTSCMATTPPVCAGAGEIEAPVVNDDLANMSLYSDQNRGRFPAAILGSVWTGTTSKHPASGATIEVDPSQGIIEYVDLPPAGSSRLAQRTTSSTGSTGLFILFTNTLASVKIQYNGRTTSVMMSGIDNSPGGAIFVVN